MDRIKIDRRQALRLGAGALGGAALSPHSALAQGMMKSGDMKKVTVASTAGNTGKTIAEMLKRRGTFEKYGLEAEWLFLTSGTKVVTALLADQADICRASGFGQVLTAQSKGATLKVVGGASIVITQALYAKDPSIKTLKDLEGKNVGSGAPGALLHHMTTALLKKKGVDVSKVNFVAIGSSAQVFRALIAGTIDAGPSQIDVYQDMEKYGVHSLAEFWTELSEYPYQACYSTERAIKEKRDELVRTLAAFGDVYDYLQNDPSSKDEWLSSYEAATGKKPGKGPAAAWDWNQKYKPYNLLISPDSINYLQDLNIEAGIQSEKMSIDRIADFSMAQEAMKLMS